MSYSHFSAKNRLSMYNSLRYRLQFLDFSNSIAFKFLGIFLFHCFKILEIPARGRIEDDLRVRAHPRRGVSGGGDPGGRLHFDERGGGSRPDGAPVQQSRRGLRVHPVGDESDQHRKAEAFVGGGGEEIRPRPGEIPVPELLPHRRRNHVRHRLPRFAARRFPQLRADEIHLSPPHENAQIPVYRQPGTAVLRARGFGED